MAVAQLEIRSLSFRYPNDPHLTLSNVSFSVQEGEFVVICGASGSGKSTLLKQLKRELRPHGERTGSILYNRAPLEEYPLSQLAEDIGMVMQDPDNQIVVDDVLHELVFGMENLGLRPDTMRRRAAELVQLFAMEGWLYKRTHELSGGQKQALNLASVLALQPKIVLLDEPTSQLDPVSAKDFWQLIRRVNEDFGMTIIAAEHRLDDLFAICDRVVMLEAGEIIIDSSPHHAVRQLWNRAKAHNIENTPNTLNIQNASQGLSTDWRHFVPAVPALFLRCEQIAPSHDPREIPLTVKEGRQWARTVRFHPVEKDNRHYDALLLAEDEPLLHCKQLNFQYGPHEPFVLHQCSLKLYRGDFLALAGGNGSGKTTLLKAIAGLITPQSGKIVYRGEKLNKHMRKHERLEIGYLAQNPLPFFAFDTVEEELLQAAFGIPHREERIRAMCDLFELHGLLRKHPYDCSGGEMQKVALACVLLGEPQLVLLDEPTKGMDPAAKRTLGERLLELNRRGLTILLITHDVEFAAEFASRCALMFNGRMTAEGAPRDFFSGSWFYTTTVNRVVRQSLPKAIVLQDVRKHDDE